MFQLEVLRAKYGDCLILHFGDSAAPRRILIDGGPSWTYGNSLEPRLRALQADPAQSILIELLMVSHVDVDHIGGIIKLFHGLAQARADHEAPLVDIAELWHNSFADIIPERTQTRAEPAGIELADLGAKLSDGLPEGAKLVLAGIKEGRILRQLAQGDQVPINPGTADGLVLTGTKRSLGGLELSVLGPGREEVEDLRREWDKKVQAILEAETAVETASAERELDGAIANLSSIVVLAEAEDRRMLLTGDGRGDKILEALGLGDSGTIHVDLYKWPHHGSIRNIPEGFFRRVTAEHHVVSADGRHGNPDLETFEQFFAERPRDRPFTLHMTYGTKGASKLRSHYPAAELDAIFERARNEGHEFDVKTPGDGEHSLTVDLSAGGN